MLMKIKNLIKNSILSFALIIVPSAKASVTINFDIGEITSSSTLVNSGTFLFISHGSNNSFESTSWTSGASFLKGDDLLMGAFAIVNGSATSAMSGYVSPVGYGTTRFTGVFVAGLTSSQINYSTGSLSGGLSFAASGGSSYAFGTYRTDAIEGFGFGPEGNMAWVIPPDAAALSLFASTNTDIGGSGLYTGADISAALATTSSLNVIPEPSSSILLSLGLGVLALRSRNSARGVK